MVLAVMGKVVLLWIATAPEVMLQLQWHQSSNLHQAPSQQQAQLLLTPLRHNMRHDGHSSSCGSLHNSSMQTYKCYALYIFTTAAN